MVSLKGQHLDPCLFVLGCISLFSRAVSLHAADAALLLMPRFCICNVTLARARCGNRFPGEPRAGGTGQAAPQRTESSGLTAGH